MLYDRCLCGNPLDSQDPDESIYCSVACARQDALDSLSARDPRHSTSSLSSLSCPSLAGTDESGESDEGVWEWVTTPSSLQSSYRSHYQRVQSLREEPDSGDEILLSPSSSRAKRVPLSFVENRVLDGDRSCTPCSLLREATPVPRVASSNPRTMSQVMESLVVKDASILDQYSYSDHLSILDAYARDPTDDFDEDSSSFESHYQHSNPSSPIKAYRNLPEIPARSHTPLPSYIKQNPPSPSKPFKRVPTPIDVHAANQNQSPSMRRLVEALDRLSISPSVHDSSTSPRGFPSATRENPGFRIQRQIPSTTSSTSSLGPVTPSDEEISSWTLAAPATVPKISNSDRFHDTVAYEPIGRKRGAVDRIRCGGVKTSPRYM